MWSFVLAIDTRFRRSGLESGLPHLFKTVCNVVRDGAVHWFCFDVCCRWLYLRWTNGVESLWMASAICIMTCGMADGTEVSSIGETESLGCMVDLEEGDSVFA